jgi:DNA-3-methyladenine glycosylase II
VPRTPALYRKAMTHLRAVDPVMARVIECVGPITLQPRSEGTHFDILIRSIVYQQLSGKAAATIHGRVTGLFSGDRPLPEQIAAIDHDALRGAGLSNQKARYVRNLAQHVLDGALPVETLHELSDDEIIAALTQVKGIGRWSAQMFLMFRLVRPDVLPDLDLGVQKGIQRAYGLRKLPTPKKVLEIGAKWAPYRTLGAWYMWRVLERPEDFPAGPKRKKKSQPRTAQVRGAREA